ncbi:MAG: DUF2207 domain-containing protein [Candidatus Obscuribacterales bacterium]|nr:DUF2207 domain-containing protein [Candidatus Obscuribacterales bacterium]
MLSSDATLTESGRLLVHETLDIDLTGGARHGISRTIPTKVDEQGINHTFFVKVHGVSDKNGHRVPYSVKQHGDGVTIRIDTAHSGNSTLTFTIDYEVRGVCNFTKQHPQLYFTFTGHEWPFVVEKTQVVLRPPSKFHLNESELKAWEGPPGSNRPASIKLIGDHVLATASDLPPGSGLTFEIDFPRGTILPATFIDHFEWLVDDWYLLIALPLLAVALLTGYRLIRSRRAARTANLEENWRPPHDLTPVELGTLIDGSCDVQDLTGILLDLSIRGYYTIREIPATGFFNLSDRDYEFKKQGYPQTDKLHDYETLFLEALFGNATTSYLSNVQGGFRQFVPKIKDSIYINLISNGFLLKNPEKDKKRFYAIGFSMCCVGIALLFLYGEETIAKAAGLGFVVAGALVAVALQFFPLLTENGKDTIDRAHEFAELMRTAEAHNMGEKLSKDPLLFHRLLPYAMVLGVSEKWAAACEPHLELWPDWFQFHRGSAPVGPFVATDFARDVWIAARVAGLTFFAPPPVQYSSYAVGKMGTRKEQEHDG